MALNFHWQKRIFGVVVSAKRVQCCGFWVHCSSSEKRPMKWCVILSVSVFPCSPSSTSRDYLAGLPSHFRHAGPCYHPQPCHREWSNLFWFFRRKVISFGVNPVSPLPYCPGRYPDVCSRVLSSWTSTLSASLECRLGLCLLGYSLLLMTCNDVHCGLRWKM